MNIKGLHISVIIVTLMMAGRVSAQDPGLQDSLIIGHLNRSIISVGLNQEIILPVWIKTDDSVTFFHTPLATDDYYISMRLGGELYAPLSLWDDVSFLAPDPNSPSAGMTSQSILGFAYLYDPRDPQNFLYTNYQWWHVADFHMLTTSDSAVIGDTICLAEGMSPANGGLLWSIPEGLPLIVPAALYPCLYFSENSAPEFTEPDPGAQFDVNNEFPIRISIVATDADNDMISITYDFSEDGVQFDTVNIMPGYSNYRFSWRPAVEDTGQFPATFTADDGHGGIVSLDIAINVEPALLQAGEVSGFPCMEVSVSINLINLGETSFIGGFEILVNRGIPGMIELLNVQPGPRVSGWEYFNSNLNDSSTVRIIGIADIYGNGNVMPPGSGPIAFLNFRISGDSAYVGGYAEINFVFQDTNDNTLSDSTGYLLVHPEVDDGWIYDMDPDDVLTGDINLNGVAWEISDAVLLGNHLINPDLFPFNFIQMQASDTNQDGLQATLPDLVYLINVINGNIPPPRLLNGEGAMAYLNLVRDEARTGRLIFIYEAPLPAGGILARLDHGGSEILSLSTGTGLNMLSADKDGILSVLLFDYNGGVIYPGRTAFEAEVSNESIPAVMELQISDRYGYFIPAGGRSIPNTPGVFALYGAYPNPFNSSASIKFSLPKQADVDLSIYNILGQVVRSFRFEDMPAGERSIDWEGKNDSGGTVASGVYLYRITAGEYEAASRMTLLK